MTTSMPSHLYDNHIAQPLVWQPHCPSLCLNFFHLLARKPNLETFSIYSNKFFHNFHLSESSFTCPGHWASGLVQRLFSSLLGDTLIVQPLVWQPHCPFPSKISLFILLYDLAVQYLVLQHDVQHLTTSLSTQLLWQPNCQTSCITSLSSPLYNNTMSCRPLLHSFLCLQLSLRNWNINRITKLNQWQSYWYCHDHRYIVHR